MVFQNIGQTFYFVPFMPALHILTIAAKKQRVQMEVPKVDRMFFFSTFRLCNDQAKQAERAIINIQKGVFQTAECGYLQKYLELFDL